MRQEADPKALRTIEDAAPTTSSRLGSAVSAVQTKAKLATSTAIALAIITPLVIYPVYKLYGSIVVEIARGGTGTLSSLYETISSPSALTAIWGTSWLTVVTVAIAVPLGAVLAWISSSTDAPFARQLASLPLLALAVPPLVGTIGWLMMLAPTAGILNILVRATPLASGSSGPFNAYSLYTIVLLMVLYVTPYVYAFAYAALRNIDSSIIDAARVSGASRVDVVRTVTLPMVRTPLLAGSLIAAVLAASTFVIPLLLSSGTGLRVIPTTVYQLVSQQGRVEEAIVMGGLLSFLTIVAMLAYLRTTRGRHMVSIGGKGFRPHTTALGRLRWVASGVLLSFVLVAIVLPVGGLLYISSIGYWSTDLFNQSLSLDQYRQVLGRSSAVKGLVNSTWLAGAAAFVAVTLGTVLAAYESSKRSRFRDFVSVVGTLPLGLPAIVIGLAVLVAYTGSPLALYGTPLILILAYASSMLPIGLRSSEAALRQIGSELEESARVSGAGGIQVFRDVTLPLIKRPLIAAWAMCFIILFRDLPMSILLYTPQTIVSSVGLLGILESGSVPAAAAYSIMISGVSVAGVIALGIISRGRGTNVL